VWEKLKNKKKNDVQLNIEKLSKEDNKLELYVNIKEYVKKLEDKEVKKFVDKKDYVKKLKNVKDIKQNVQHKDIEDILKNVGIDKIANM
jgi:hypothetical protein